MEAKACSFCGNPDVQMKAGQTYHFTESGLDNLYLVNVDTFHCPDCGADSVSIPQPKQLLERIGQYVVFSSGLLSGQEIRFLRKNLRIKINDFAKILRVSRVTVSRWENGQTKIPKTVDLLIRSIYLIKGPGISEEARNQFKEWLEKQHVAKKRKQIRLRLPLDPPECLSTIACAV
jgi:putative transcriptional regulator